MLGKVMKRQAFSFALTISAVAFVLSIWLTHEMTNRTSPWLLSLVMAVTLGVLSWGAASRLTAQIASSATAAVSRLAYAASGDLDAPMPTEVTKVLPELSVSLDNFFANVRSSMDQANSMALFDAVTALPNRVHFRNETELALSQLHGKTRSALYFIDLDHFKNVNDTLGHAAGDQVLIKVANRLREVVALVSTQMGKSAMRPIPGRLAGDEFTLFLPEVRNKKFAESVADMLINALNEPYMIAGQRIDMGASIGVAMRPNHGMALTSLMRAADVAMYKAKAEGRGHAHFYTNDLAAELAQRERLDQDLKLALEHGEFGFVFQPQVDLRTMAVVAAESLLRWNHPTDGVRLPASFLKQVEESGLIFELSDWALDELVSTAARWEKEGFSPRVSINLGKRELNRSGLAAKLLAMSGSGAMPLHQCEFEISEHLAMNLSDVMQLELSLLRAYGASIAIDNFGSGNSNLSKLKTLPVDRVKLDPALVKDLGSDAEARVIVQGLIGIIHGVGKQVVAQGVETHDQMEILEVMGCDAVQGYGIAHPMTQTDLWKWRAPSEAFRQKRVQ
ncbi:MAG: hypothetical protein RIS52_270 [Pseudomonadota bacterium]|jgi:diguanylate cyclase